MIVKRYDMEKEYSLDINITPVEETDGAFVHHDDYASLQKINNELLEALQSLNNAIDYGTSMDVVQAQEVAQDVIAKALGETK